MADNNNDYDDDAFPGNIKIQVFVKYCDDVQASGFLFFSWRLDV